MKYSKKFRVHWRRFIRGSKNKLSPNYKLTETQELAVGVIRRAIVHPDAELLIAPISGTKYINRKDVYIQIETQFVKITNGSYSYHIDLDERTIGRLVHKFNTMLESTRKEWENTINTKTNKSLSNLYKELDKRN